jgi:hypothetical protein
MKICKFCEKEFYPKNNGNFCESKCYRKGETIHHKNGIRDDNRLENLELWVNTIRYGQRLEDKILWCKDFLEQYGYKVIMKENKNE